MKEYYIRIQTLGTNLPDIIDEEAMYQAEQGMNYLNPDEYMFLCEAEHMFAAKEFYMEEFSRMANDMVAEHRHP